MTEVSYDSAVLLQTEEALRRSEERYRSLWQRNLAGVFRISLDGRILDCNDSLARIFGYASREEMLRHSTKELYFDLSLREEYLARLRAHRHLSNYEICMRRADGSPIWVLENVSMLHEDGEEILEGTLIDISERKRAEEALRASETNYRTLIHHLDQAIFLKDRQLRYVTVNPVFCDVFGLKEEEVRGKTSRQLFPPEVLKRSPEIEEQVLRDGCSIQTEDEMMVYGKPRTVRINRTPVKDEAGQVAGVLGICWDVTDQRAMEAQLRHVQKMDAIGQLAGGIAHDFNNLLTIMLGNLSFLLNENPNGTAARELLRNTETAGLRAAELTNTLLGFSRRNPLSTMPYDLHHAIEEVMRFTRSTIPVTIDLEVRTQPGLWLVQADPGQINQVLTNLTLNARDAMTDGGSITFETSHFVPDGAYLATHLEARPGEYVRLSVRDTGCGIPADIRQRIFEPFFTTKNKGKGTGLGLAIVFSIVKQHRGWIVCESALNQGTCFELFLPRCQSAPAAVANPAPSRSAPAAPRETVLIVDDESMIRKLAKTILTRAGYEVLLAENGEQAINIYGSQSQQIALVVLDAKMPRLSGNETLRELIKLNPHVRVLFSSGYSTEPPSPTEFPQVHAFLPKPYRADVFLEKVREILEKR